MLDDVHVCVRVRSVPMVCLCRGDAYLLPDRNFPTRGRRAKTVPTRFSSDDGEV